MIYSRRMSIATRREFIGGLAAAAQCQPRPPLKIFVLWDMEGTSGILGLVLGKRRA
jgi:hypothetical protein